MNPNDRTNAEQAKHEVDVVLHKLQELITHLKGEIPKLSATRVQAIFETAAEVLFGLQTAFMHYRSESDPAIPQAGPQPPRAA